MAILTPKKRTRILSRYQGQNSRISNIEDVTVYKSRSTGIVDEIFEESLTYEVFFDVDLKRLLASNASHAEFRVLSSPTIKKLNIFSTLNLIPTKGMTLPFLSYGGSSLISCAILIGFILSLSKKKYEKV